MSPRNGEGAIMTGVPFNRASTVGREFDYMAQALGTMHISGDGTFTRRCQERLATELGTHKVLLTTSCTHALEMAAFLLEIHAGDEVIVPSFTFVSTVNAFVLRGARPVFVDIREDTLNLDETRLEEKITGRAKAIVPVHYAGVGCQMDVITDIARRHRVRIVEDNAHGLFGNFRGKPLGTFGDLATLSFHETKSFTCGEGGALLINDESLVDRAEIIREKGTNRSRFFRGQVDRYTWVDLGSSYLPSDLLAAFLLAQLEQRDAVQTKRRHIFERYELGLHSWAARHGVRLPIVPEGCDCAYHLFYLLLPDLAARQRLIAWLKERGISSVFHYLPLHASPMGLSFGYRQGDCPVTERISDQLVRLPYFFGLTAAEQDRVIEAVQAFCP
jgi:dTDP-4-amino-4,6-dideoxygalactose transaminase